MPVTEAEFPVRVSMIEQLRHRLDASWSKKCAQSAAAAAETE
jgi:hypothetical protein